MSLFSRKKKQLEAEWQIEERKPGESIQDVLDRVLRGKPAAKGELKQPPSDGEWLMAAALARLSMEHTINGLEAVRASRKVGLN